MCNIKLKVKDFRLNRILLIGPFTPPYTGQSIAFSYLKKIETNELDLEFYNTQKFGFYFLNYFSSVFFLPLRILCSNYPLIYFIGSRSKFGFLRQAPFLLTTIILRKKIINHLHGADFYDFYQNSSFLKPLVKFCYDRVNISIVLLEAMKKEFVDFPQMKLEVVPNAYETNFEFSKISFPKPKNILYLSNVMASKGILEFLVAADILLKENTDLTISIAGGFIGDHIKKKSQIKTSFYNHYNLLKDKYKDRINYFGVLTGRKKKELFLKNSIFILPTYYPTEAFPISIIEAMRTGNAIITTKHNYLGEIINQSNGRLIAKHSVREIVDATKFLLNDTSLLQQIQEYNIQISSKEYTLINYLTKVKKIIRDVV